MINDVALLESRLGAYFRTNRFKSFLRQLYSYKFKCIHVGEVRKYKNPEFVQSAFHNLVKIKLGSGSNEKSERQNLQDSYNLLKCRYAKLQKSVVALQEQIGINVDNNRCELLTLLDFKFCFVERFKAAILHFCLAAAYDVSVAARSIGIMRRFNYIDDEVLATFSQNKGKVEFIPDCFKRYINDTFLVQTDNSSYIAELLRLSIGSLNKKHFQLPKARMFDYVLRFMIKDERVPELEAHHNFHILVERKKVFDTVSKYLLKNFISKNVDELVKNLFGHREIEISAKKTNDSVTSYEDKGSIMSLGLMNLSVYDGFNSSKMTLDDY